MYKRRDLCRNFQLKFEMLFSPLVTRDASLRNLEHLLSAEEWLKDPEDEDAFDLMFNESEKRDISIQESYLKNKDKYEIVIEFINSY